MGNELRLTIQQAAQRLGVSVDTVRRRLHSGALRGQRDNTGQWRVALASGDVEMPMHEVPSAVHRQPMQEAPEARQSPQDNPEAVPLALHQETIEAIQRTSSAALAAIQEQVEHLRSDITHERAQAARQLAERDALHLDAIGRMQAQTAVERSLWLERVDAAELRAERVEQRLDQVLDVLLTERWPWWERWFGHSKRSDLGK